MNRTRDALGEKCKRNLCPMMSQLLGDGAILDHDLPIGCVGLWHELPVHGGVEGDREEAFRNRNKIEIQPQLH